MGRLLHYRQGLPGSFCGASASTRTPSPARRWVFITNNFSRSGRHHLRALQKPLAGGTLRFKWIKQHLRIKQFYGGVGERGEDADLDCRLGLRPRRHRQEAPRPGRLALHFVTDPLGDPLRENAHTSSTCVDRLTTGLTERFARDARQRVQMLGQPTPRWTLHRTSRKVKKDQKTDHPKPPLEPSTPSGLTSNKDEPDPPL